MAAPQPYDAQTWDTTSYVNPTRMNHIEQGISDGREATNIKFDANNSVKSKIDSMNADNIPYDSSNSVKDKIDTLNSRMSDISNKMPLTNLSNVTFQSLADGRMVIAFNGRDNIPSGTTYVTQMVIASNSIRVDLNNGTNKSVTLT